MLEQPVNPDLRLCSRCKVEKPATREHFSYIRVRDKLHPWCKPCCAEDRRRDRAENPGRYKAIDQKRDPERRRQNGRKSYHRHRDTRLAEMRSPDRLARNNLARIEKRRTDPEYAARQRAREREWRLSNPDRFREIRRQAWANASLQRRLRCHFTSAICHSLKGSTKGGRSWQTILGYTVDELRAHLERQFSDGMSWANYGEWHVDHIVPVAAFDFSGPDDPEFKACWAMTNLRPLWAKDNLSKRERRTHLI